MVGRHLKRYLPCGARRDAFEHPSGAIDPDRLARLQTLVEDPRERARPASQIDHAHVRRRANERQQIAAFRPPPFRTLG
jgi:hypothetical protein